MAGSHPSLPTLSFVIFLLLLATPPHSHATTSLSQWRTLFSLAHSLMTRVANLRASRGDSTGAYRARLVAQKLDRVTGLGFWKLVWSIGWDYLRNYAWQWRDVASADLSAALKDLSELLRSLDELTRLDSGVDRAAWVQRNYGTVLRASTSLFRRFLTVFRQSVRFLWISETPSVIVFF